MNGGASQWSTRSGTVGGHPSACWREKIFEYIVICDVMNGAAHRIGSTLNISPKDNWHWVGGWVVVVAEIVLWLFGLYICAIFHFIFTYDFCVCWYEWCTCWFTIPKMTNVDLFWFKWFHFIPLHLNLSQSHTYHKHLQSNYSRKHRFITPIQHLAIRPIVHLFKTWMAQNLPRFQSQNTGETINYLHLLLAAIMQSATISQLLRNNETIPKAVHHRSGGSQHNWIHTVRGSSCPNRISIT